MKQAYLIEKTKLNLAILYIEDFDDKKLSQGALDFYLKFVEALKAARSLSEDMASKEDVAFLKAINDALGADQQQWLDNPELFLNACTKLHKHVTDNYKRDGRSANDLRWRALVSILISGLMFIITVATIITVVIGAALLLAYFVPALPVWALIIAKGVGSITGCASTYLGILFGFISGDAIKKQLGLDDTDYLWEILFTGSRNKDRVTDTMLAATNVSDKNVAFFKPVNEATTSEEKQFEVDINLATV